MKQDAILTAINFRGPLYKLQYSVLRLMYFHWKLEANRLYLRMYVTPYLFLMKLKKEVQQLPKAS